MPAPPLRLGVLTAAFDDQRRLLAARRSDLNVWALPGGRLDAGERLTDAAAREVREETGIEVDQLQPHGLYYLEGWRRLNILYTGRAAGGGLLDRTFETRESAFLSEDALLMRLSGPPPLQAPIADALTPRRPMPRVITTPPAELRRLRVRFGLRYLANALRGRPEPRYPRFEVRAAALVWDTSHRRVLTLKRGSGRALPRILCDGRRAPWAQLADAVAEACGLPIELHWVGLWQDAPASRLDLVFAATAQETPLFRAGEWTTARSAPLSARDAAYVERVRPTFARDPVWQIEEAALLSAGATIAMD